MNYGVLSITSLYRQKQWLSQWVSSTTSDFTNSVMHNVSLKLVTINHGQGTAVQDTKSIWFSISTLRLVALNNGLLLGRLSSSLKEEGTMSWKHSGSLFRESRFSRIIRLKFFYLRGTRLWSTTRAMKELTGIKRTLSGIPASGNQGNIPVWVSP